MAESTVPDKALIKAYLAGDTSSFNELYERYRRPLYSYLNKMFPGQTATADDVFQKTWMKAINHLARYEDQQTFFSWLVRIARNTGIDHVRREQRRQAVDIDDVSVAADGPAPWSNLSEAELKTALNGAVDQLPDEQREVFLLRQRGVPFKEIAAIQDCSLNTVLGRMHYAINKLRQMLEEFRT